MTFLQKLKTKLNRRGKILSTVKNGSKEGTVFMVITFFPNLAIIGCKWDMFLQYVSLALFCAEIGLYIRSPSFS